MYKNINKFKKDFALIIFATIPAIILCFISHFIFPISTDFTSDFRYIKSAKDILINGEYFDYSMPLYPYFLSYIFKLFGNNLENYVHLLIISINALCHGITSFLIAKIASFFNKKWFLPTLILSSFWPHLIWRTTFVMPETFFILFFVSSLFFIFLYFRKEKINFIIFSGIFFGLASLTKATGIISFFIFPIFLLFFLFKKKYFNFLTSLKIILIFIIFTLSISSFQLMRIYKQTGHISYSIQTGNVALFYIYPCLQTKFGCGKKDRPAMYEAWEAFDKEMIDAKYPDSINLFYMNIVKKEIAIKLIKEIDLNQIFIATFGGYVKLFLHNFTYDVFQRLKIKSTHLTEFTGSFYTKIKLMISNIFTQNKLMLFWLFAQLTLIFSRLIQFVGLFYLNERNNKFYEFIFLFIFFIPTLFPILAQGTIRYRAPIEPLLIILTISGLFFLYNFLKKNIKKIR